MDDSNKREFAQIIRDAFEVYDKEVSPGKLRLYFESLKRFSLEQISQAVSDHVSSSKFSPKPADIIEILASQDGRPNENEAWSMSLISKDEDETIVWTDEMAEAFAVANQILLTTKDIQGAKLAFREKYSKLVTQARKDMKPIRWAVSLGHDKTRTNDAINQAVIDKKLSHEDSTRYLIDSTTDDGKAIAGLLTGEVVDMSEHIRSKLKEVQEVIKSTKSHSEKYREQAQEVSKEYRDKIELKKKKVDEFLNENEIER